MGQPYITTGINFFKTEPGSLYSAQMDRPSLWYFICLQRTLLMGVGTLERLTTCSLSFSLPSLPSFEIYLPTKYTEVSCIFLSICCSQYFYFLSYSDNQTVVVLTIQAIPLSVLLFCSQGKSLEKQHQQLPLPSIQDSAGLEDKDSSGNQ